jgi:hypothetical protein
MSRSAAKSQLLQAVDQALVEEQRITRQALNQARVDGELEIERQNQTTAALLNERRKAARGKADAERDALVQAVRVRAAAERERSVQSIHRDMLAEKRAADEKAWRDEAKQVG